ncbi:hypothetical protein Ssi02_57270 [Sinosporangium siamense]|uniref:Dolichyl-phosphate-mannose-protein mannosyltransferase n=1 Tax=Sinosporangium siamense TaxID=1367973 RepID=A0A919RKG6_9ACTN|nr:hypothetical protein Ssi02_57270 [Sinosporangium siamense]
MVLLAAAAVRVLLMLTYPMAQVYWYDSFTYLDTAVHMKPPGALHPAGYSAFLWLFRPFGSVALVAAVQHVMGLGIALMIYMLLRRRGLPGWGAALATVPVLFDPSFMRLEHAILSDTLVIFLLVAAITVLMWRAKVSVRAAAIAGPLIALAGLSRTVAVPVLGLAVLYLIACRAGVRVVAVMAVAGALPLLAYAGWYASHHGRFALSGSDGVALWARTMTFADCSVVKPPEPEARLCPNGTVVDAASEYVWAPGASLNRLPGDRFSHNALARSFALRAIAAQPFDYLREVVRDTSITFSWTPIAHPKRVTTPAATFPVGTWSLPEFPLIDKVKREYDSDIRALGAAEPYASLLSAYYYPLILRGPLFGLMLVAGAAGLFMRRRQALLPWAAAVFMLVAPVAALGFDHRYVLPAVPPAALAAALGAHSLVRGLRRRRRNGEPAREADRAIDHTHVAHY